MSVYKRPKGCEAGVALTTPRKRQEGAIPWLLARLACGTVDRKGRWAGIKEALWVTLWVSTGALALTTLWG